MAILLAVAPIPFLSGSDSDTIGDRIVRIGQAFARAQLVDASLLPVRATSSVYTIEGVSFELEVLRNLPFDELSAIDSAVKEQSATSQFSSASRVLFNGWEPAILPVRIPFRYFLLLAALFLIFGVYVLLRRSRHSNDQ